MLYNIPVDWKALGLMHIEAESLEEAVKKAETEPLPDDWEYADDSFGVDVAYGIRFSNPDGLTEDDKKFLDKLEEDEKH